MKFESFEEKDGEVTMEIRIEQCYGFPDKFRTVVLSPTGIKYLVTITQKEIEKWMNNTTNCEEYWTEKHELSTGQILVFKVLGQRESMGSFDETIEGPFLFAEDEEIEVDPKIKDQHFSEN